MKVFLNLGLILIVCASMAISIDILITQGKKLKRFLRRSKADKARDKMWGDLTTVLEDMAADLESLFEEKKK